MTLSKEASGVMSNGMQEAVNSFIDGLHRERRVSEVHRELTIEEVRLATKIFQIGYAAGFRRGLECLPCVTR